MTHDPLCPYRDGPWWTGWCPQCERIAEVRADEREQAATRVALVFLESPAAGVYDAITYELLGRDAAIAAARGEVS